MKLLKTPNTGNEKEMILDINSVVESSTDFIYVVDRRCRYLFMNKIHLSRLGISRDKVSQSSYGDYHIKEQLKGFKSKVEEVFRTGKPVRQEHGSKRDNLYYLRTFSPMRFPYTGEIIDVSVISSNISTQKQLEQELRDAQQTLSNIFDFLPDATVAIDTRGIVLTWNRAAEEMTGIKAGDIIGKGDYEYALPFYNERRPILIDLALKSDKNAEKNYTSLRRSGDILFGEAFTPNLKPGNVHLSATASVLRNYKGEIVGAIQSIRDNTERKRLEEEIRALSIIDHLTGLYNRRGFLSLAEQQLKILERSGKGMLLIFADLDDLKTINDTLGHQGGDDALIDTANILRKTFRKADVIGRIGGDEFAVLALSGLFQKPEILKAHLERNIKDFNDIRQKGFQISLSVGVAHYDPKSQSGLDELLSKADQRMYQEKSRKKLPHPAANA